MASADEVKAAFGRYRAAGAPAAGWVSDPIADTYWTAIHGAIERWMSLHPTPLVPWSARDVADLLTAIGIHETGDTWARRTHAGDFNLWNVSGEYGPLTSAADGEAFGVPSLAVPADMSVRRAALTVRGYPSIWHAIASTVRYLWKVKHDGTGRYTSALALGLPDAIPAIQASGYTPDPGWAPSVARILTRGRPDLSARVAEIGPALKLASEGGAQNLADVLTAVQTA